MNNYEDIHNQEHPNKDSCFSGCGRSLQFLIDQEIGLMNVNTVSMNIKGTIGSNC